MLCSTKLTSNKDQFIFSQLSNPAENEFISKIYRKGLRDLISPFLSILIAVVTVRAVQIDPKRSKGRDPRGLLVLQR